LAGGTPRSLRRFIDSFYFSPDNTCFSYFILMHYYADLHIHSKYSRATSSQLDFEHLWLWAQIKGIQVVATGDCVHPQWYAEIKKKLSPCGNGLFELKPEFCKAAGADLPPSCKGEVRFILSTEISSIYKRDGKVRKVHNVVYVPDFPTAEKLAAKLEDIGNIRSDGRPILGLDSRDLLDIVLSCNPDSFLIPAHVWTPWFSVLGSKSGFNSIEECFGDLTKYIYALETGLSSDPLMNWRLSCLDKFVLVSNSDAHSPKKLGREANILDTDLSYAGLLNALRDPENKGLLGTVEFFPEEGKYHYDGHRKCETRMHPRDTIKNKGLCPVCGKPVTVGVMARVEELADRPEGEKGGRWRPYKSMIPLTEIIGDCLGVGPASQKVDMLYQKLVQNVGGEFTVLLDAPLDRIEKTAGPMAAEGVRRVRSGEITVKAGYDGEYGIIKIFSDKEREMKKWQINLFDDDALTELSSVEEKIEIKKAAVDLKQDVKKKAGFEKSATNQTPHIPQKNQSQKSGAELNEAQKAAVNHTGSHLLIVAGPGTGKTHTLVHRIAKTIPLLKNGEKVLAITFTNKASEEMRERIESLVGRNAEEAVICGTFHRFCLGLLRAYPSQAEVPEKFTIATDRQRDAAAQKAFPGWPPSRRRDLLEQVSRNKSTSYREPASPEAGQYNVALHDSGFIDFDDILCAAVKLLDKNEPLARDVRSKYRHLFVDEYQDINEVQHELLKLLVQNGVSITAIGDPNQAIYGFRGSDVRFFERFAESFPGAATMVLSENYRSAPNLLEASGHVISAGNAAGVPPLVARLFGEGMLTIYEAATDSAEAEYIVHQIEKLVGGTSMFSHDSGRVESGESGEKTFGDFAVLYRTNAQSRLIVEAFERSSIPFQVSGEKPLSEYEVVRNVIAVLKIVSGGQVDPDEEATLKKSMHIRKNDQAWEGMITIAAQAFRTSGVKAALDTFITWPGFAELLNNEKGGKELLDRLLRIAGLNNSFQTFADYLQLQQGDDAIERRAEKVSLLTLHAAKGLEFPVVFIAGCEHGLVPLVREGKEYDPLEERRLFYVGMTRAKELLYLTGARRRTIYGKINEARPSPFLADIKEELKTYEKAMKKKTVKKAESEQMNIFDQLL
jgi:DNA helicase-2/ATP-dependent DNA helicase PcrA